MSNKAWSAKRVVGRNSVAVAAWNRTGAGFMHDRREGRGGTRNDYRTFLEDAEEFALIERELDENSDDCQG